uniref:Uncharacterized protein n=1 Tax=Toxoplasma gondii (strain ATCC 50861 / VEG) TaxID=432359 RepID=A0A0F7V081_TOXGV|nr:TPA: hypothetical protein BN1205_036310 [Toxoplasma gondii VEG]
MNDGHGCVLGKSQVRTLPERGPTGTCVPKPVPPKDIRASQERERATTMEKRSGWWEPLHYAVALTGHGNASWEREATLAMREHRSCALSGESASSVVSTKEPLFPLYEGASRRRGKRRWRACGARHETSDNNRVKW